MRRKHRESRTFSSSLPIENIKKTNNKPTLIISNQSNMDRGPRSGQTRQAVNKGNRTMQAVEMRYLDGKLQYRALIIQEREVHLGHERFRDELYVDREDQYTNWKDVPEVGGYSNL